MAVILELTSLEYFPIQPASGIKFTKVARTKFGNGLTLIELDENVTRHIMRKLKISRKTDLFPILEEVKITLIFE